MEPAGDVHRTIEYSTDISGMRLVPVALMFCLVGFAILLNVEPRPSARDFVKAFVMMAAALLIVVSIHVAFDQATEGRTKLLRLLGIAVVIGVIIAYFATARHPTDIFRYRRSTGAFSPPLLGWVALIIGVSWVAFALWRHVRPAPPMLSLTTQGLSFDALGMRGLRVPWTQVKGVGPLERMFASGYPLVIEEATGVLISREFFEAEIVPKRGMMCNNKTWDSMFVPKGDDMQMALYAETFAIDPKLIRGPIEARWKAFGEISPPDAVTANNGQPPFVIGKWSWTGSTWQLISFGVPIAAILAVLAHGSGVFGR